MVDAERIADEVEALHPIAVGLSGLISPSLGEMIKVLEEFNRRGIDLPVIIGGATTSRLHTAVKMAPVYHGLVVHTRDASENVAILSALTGSGRDEYIAKTVAEQTKLRESAASAGAPKLRSLAEAREHRFVKDGRSVVVPKRLSREVFNGFPIEDVVRYIDWSFFFPAWEIKGRYPDLLDDPKKGEEARRLLADAKSLLDRIIKENLLTLHGVVELCRARKEGDDIILINSAGRMFKLPQLRNQQADAEFNLSLADYVADDAEDYVGVFALTAGIGLDKLRADFAAAQDDYNAIMSKLLTDRLTEAFAEAIHEYVRRNTWGYETGAEMTPEDIIAGRYDGVRVAFGYPACPDHSQKADVFEITGAERLTEMSIGGNYMITPGESVCGLMFAGDNKGYFGVGKIDAEQLSDYARRRGLSKELLEKLMPNNV
jgi:5-methyltetrahydrofolate--homocysteine methyltransferase